MRKLTLVLGACALAFAGCDKKADGEAAAAKPLRMITEATFPPYEFLRGQEIVGIDVEICRAVAQKLGRPFQAETVDFDSVIPAVISGKADVGAAGITVTEDRKKNVDFSIPYVKTGIVVIYKKDNPFKDVAQLKDKRIGVQGGTTSENYVLEQLKKEPERSKSPAEAVAALKSGRVDFVIADVDPAKNCVKGESDLALSDFITSEEYAVAIKKGQPELLKTIDDTIAELKANGQLEKWVQQFTEESDKLKEK
ncbi:MAG: ABC transporter substrate-binding protein [Kiritimatiellae bacterium]|nr:ABC transporter substrate-binding protein [Kiritimatiellia bacterium]